MEESFTATARSLAYRWYLSIYLDAAPGEAWDFAQGHWQEFVNQGIQAYDGWLGSDPDDDEESPDDFDDIVLSSLEYEGPSHLLAEK